MVVAELISLSDMELTRFFLAIVLLLISAHWLGHIFQILKMPKVIGEIMGGLVLGPTLLGFFAPTVYSWIFNAFEAEGKLISIIYWLGLVFLMFISGFEVEKTANRKDKNLIIALLLGATIIPFVAGWLAPSFYDFSWLLGRNGNSLSLKIIIAIAVGVTSIPVISKIFFDLKIIHTRFSKIVLSVATIHDVFLWVGLAIATGIVSSKGFSILSVISVVLITFAFFVGALLIMPRIIKVSNGLRLNLFIKSSPLGYILFIVFFFVVLAALFRVNIIFGAFLAGVVTGLIKEEKFEKAKHYIKEFSFAFFIPLYFAIVGLKLNLINHFNIGFFLGFLLFVTIFEVLGTIIAARIMKCDWRSSFNLGFALNAKGGPGIVLATVAFDAGIINQTFFSVLVVMAIITSLLAGYWLRYILSRGWPLLNETNVKTTLQ